MSMKDALQKWMDRHTPDVGEWVKPCNEITDDPDIRLACLKVAEEYENGGMSDMELTASLVNLTGKSLDELKIVLKVDAEKEVTPVEGNTQSKGDLVMPNQQKPTWRCGSCRSFDWWWRPPSLLGGKGEWVCGRCHPNPNPSNTDEIPI